MSVGVFLTGLFILVSGIVLTLIVGSYSDNVPQSKFLKNILYCLIPTIVLSIFMFALSCCVSSYREICLRLKYDDVITLCYYVENAPTNDLMKLKNAGYTLMYNNDQLIYRTNTTPTYYMTQIFVKNGDNLNSKYDNLVKGVK